MTDIVERLSQARVNGIYEGSLYDKLFKDAADEIERLRQKCDKQAMILQRLNPENNPGVFFICGEAGKRDANGLPEVIFVCPSYGADVRCTFPYRKETKDAGLP